jgi:hypothetical protein
MFGASLHLPFFLPPNDHSLAKTLTLLHRGLISGAFRVCIFASFQSQVDVKILDRRTTSSLLCIFLCARDATSSNAFIKDLYITKIQIDMAPTERRVPKKRKRKIAAPVLTIPQEGNALLASPLFHPQNTDFLLQLANT